jgi:hypothetical protein
VVGPYVLTGMKYGHQFASQWLLYPSGWPLEFITPTTGKTKVIKRRLATLCFGDDVVDHHRLASIGFGCLTIRATVVIYVNQLLAQVGRQVCAHGGVIICRREECDARASGAKQLPVLSGA